MAHPTSDEVRLRLAMAESELRRVNRALRMLSCANKTLVRITDEAALLREVCRIAVEVGHYRVAWIGFVDGDAPRLVRPAAQVGFPPDYLEAIGCPFPLRADDLCPVAVAIRTERPCVARNLPGDPSYAMWQACAIHGGFEASIALPLSGDGRTFGVLCMYAAEVAAFDVDEIGILSELADDLAFGLTVLRTRAERDRSAAALEETERKLLQMVAELRRQMQMNEAMFNQAITGFVLVDPQYRFLRVNESFARNYRRPASDFAGRRLDEVVPAYSTSDAYASGRGEVDTVMQTTMPIHAVNRPYEFVDQPERGVTYWDWTMQPIFDEQGKIEFLFFTSIEVTERRRAEDAVLARERELRTLTEHSPDVIMRYDREGRYLYANQAIETITGIPVKAILGRRVGEPTTAVGQAPSAADLQSLRDRIEQVVVTALPVEIEIALPCPAGLLIFDLRLVPELDEAGQVASVLGIARDVTAHRHAERAQRQLEEQLRHAQKMEAVGQLAGGIAHDFNNLLMVIKLQSSILSGSRTRRELDEGLQEIMAATERAANLTRQLLTFSRRDVRQARDLDLTEVTETMMSLVRRLLGEDIALELRCQPGLSLINADPGMMEQVLMNLAVNARDAMPDGGTLSVNLDVAIVGDDQLAAHPQAAPGRFVCLSVGDTGCGIEPENLSRVFEPFFTTKEVGRGTGLGLATVFGIVQQHHGWIDVKSEVGRGTTFRIFLPALERSAVRPVVAAAAEASRGGSETILLVEDDVTLRKLARVVLDRQGYRVLEAGTAAAALALWEAETSPVDLLLTDLVIPGGMSGYELGKEMAARQPGLKVVYTSGYSNDIVNRRLQLDPGRNFLQKPYPALDLATTVRRCLDER